ncbi:MAG TPA: hypothetical protein VEH49_07055, partial [Methylomirabilota bacterium]|nr:hypothetical protein [Methylomirabilota bacterium]
GRRPALAAQLAGLLQRQGAEVQKLEQDVDVKETPPASPQGPRGRGRPEGSATGAPPEGKKSEEPKTVHLPLGSYIIRMDQPYSRMVDMLLDTQYYSTSDPRPYDDTGWTLGPLRNVKTVRVTDLSILKAPMTLVAVPARFDGSGVAATHAAKGKSPAARAYAINASAEPGLAALRFRLKDVRFSAAEEGFEAGGEKFAAGSFVLTVDGNPGDMESRLNDAARELGIRVSSLEAVPSVPRHDVGLPRIALLHNWTDTQNEGWFRLGLEESGVPYVYISDQTVRASPNLREKFDVIISPPVFGGLTLILNGIPKRIAPDGSDAGSAVPWQNSPATPNMGGVDQSADIRGGLGLEGAEHIRKFIEDGGLFVPVGSSTRLPIDLGITDTVSIVETRQLQARGSIVRASVEDKASPIAYGYDDTVGVYFNQAPVFRVSVGGGGGGGEFGGAGEGRPSGRGSATDPDIPQGRAWNPPEPAPRRSRAEQELYVSPDAQRFSRFVPPASLYPRVVLRFAEEKDLWVSGMLAGASELANAPAVVDVPVGRGHVVLFATNPMWRHETQGSFMLLLNAALHFDHLSAGRKPPAGKPKPAPDPAGGEAN